MWTTDALATQQQPVEGGETPVRSSPPPMISRPWLTGFWWQVYAFERPGRLLRRLAWGLHPECADWIAVSVDDKLEVVHV